uniref:Uncharacterized protein n=1 Tax=Chromera velia CCMP2878 TaxID=1169474 RepID=A0A0G4IG17_9ALVE|mmetsp:Transcript_119/g.292  ORF Transcript_119/g.292 Transcript_119/m.292 type:complete len:519 (+) Transcript_119:353-1909(+)|eukprot:Cvel_14113.t1-p1 / transcript=Cvel_14113.t1 / gene=Cvel_14113 / organism=Chromera_velia_CCMP2878 / gene_product=hypothetical protein / transcript_product=hypothetical protein / location=Cvel_scaffold994:7846-9625(-) / protein_length=518 / sequence_SO=supercontig / SO=protein_coding / is_pseudo=false
MSRKLLALGALLGVGVVSSQDPTQTVPAAPAAPAEETQQQEMCASGEGAAAEFVPRFEAQIAEFMQMGLTNYRFAVMTGSEDPSSVSCPKEIVVEDDMVVNERSLEMPGVFTSTSSPSSTSSNAGCAGEPSVSSRTVPSILSEFAAKLTSGQVPVATVCLNSFIDSEGSLEIYANINKEELVLLDIMNVNEEEMLAEEEEEAEAEMPPLSPEEEAEEIEMQQIEEMDMLDEAEEEAEMENVNALGEPTSVEEEENTPDVVEPEVAPEGSAATAFSLSPFGARFARRGFLAGARGGRGRGRGRGYGFGMGRPRGFGFGPRRFGFGGYRRFGFGGPALGPVMGDDGLLYVPVISYKAVNMTDYEADSEGEPWLPLWMIRPRRAFRQWLLARGAAADAAADSTETATALQQGAEEDTMNPIEAEPVANSDMNTPEPSARRMTEVNEAAPVASEETSAPQRRLFFLKKLFKLKEKFGGGFGFGGGYGGGYGYEDYGYGGGYGNGYGGAGYGGAGYGGGYGGW